MEVYGKAPLLRIQCDWQTDVQNPADKGSFWLQYTSVSNQNCYGKVRVKKGESDGPRTNLEFVVDGEFQVLAHDLDEQKWIEIQAPEKDVVGTFQCPSKVFKPHEGKPVNCVDVSGGGEIGISGSDNGDVKLWESATGVIRRDLRGHVGDILVSKFFPSGQVVLTSGSDLQIKIWSVADGSCAANLRGHAAGVLDVAFVERGRNIVSCSRDGTAKLWETGSQTEVATLYRSSKPINSVFVCNNVNPVTPTRPLDSREYGTEGKLLLLACEDAALRGVDIREQREVFNLKATTAVTKCYAMGDTYVCGTEGGTVSLWDARNLSNPLSSFQRSSAAITAITSVTNDQVWVATADGLFFLWDIKSGKAVRDLTGPDYQPINSACLKAGTAYSASRDGFIREYKVPQQST